MQRHRVNQALQNSVEETSVAPVVHAVGNALILEIYISALHQFLRFCVCHFLNVALKFGLHFQFLLALFLHSEPLRIADFLLGHRGVGAAAF